MTSHFNTTWNIEGRVIKNALVDSPNPQILKEQESSITCLLDHAEAPLVHVLVDVTNVHHFPSIKTMKEVEWLKHPRLGWVVVFGVDNMLNSFSIRLALQLAGVRHHFSPTQEAAQEFLRNEDITLRHAL